MQRLIFQNSKGEELELTSGNYGVVNWGGLSDVPLNIQTQTVPMVDGSVYLDSVLGQRDISVTVAINDNNSLSRRYELKRELISALNPKNGEGYVIYHNDYLSRRIKAVANMPIFENKNANDSGSLKAEIVFTCCNPYWEDLAESAVNMKSFTEYTVKNEGDVPCQIKMEVANWNTPNFAVRNGRQKIALKNINDCDKIFINTNMGEKSVIKETEEWEIGNTNETFYNIAYSEELNIYVTVGGDDIILYSKDGKNWMPSMGVGYVSLYLNNIVWVKEKSFFICNSPALGSGYFYISYNGIDWEEYITESFANNEYINCICFSPKLNLFVAVGGYTTPSRLILTSSDGMNWAIQETTNVSALNTVIWSEELEIFVAVGNSGAILTSPDGVTWTSRTSGTSVNLQGIAWSKDLSFFIAGGLNLTLKSNNGTNWSQIGTETISANLIYSEDLNTFITGSLKKSSDGIIWESTTVPINVLDCIYSPVLGQFIAVGDKGCIAISDDFYTWQKVLWNEIVSNNIARNLRSCVYNKDTGLYYAVGDASVIFSSPDGKNWTSLYSGNSSKNLYSICYSEKLHLLIAVQNNNIILKSSDGTNWTAQQIQGLASGNCVLWEDSLEMFIIVGNNKIIFTSPDGVTWTSRTRGGSNLMGVTYSEKLGLFVAVGANGVILTSPDGVTWTSQTSGVSTYLNSVAWSEESELFAAVGANGVILTSPDGVTWTSQISNITYDLYSIIYSTERKSFWVVGMYGYILKSETGYNWSVTAQGGSRYFYGLCYSTPKQQFLVVGYQGAIFYNQIISDINIIDRLTADSDMSFNLEPGDNKVQIYNVPRNITARLTYRQKYIGV